ncbi:hypothetical protein GOP47_0012785 [Adiantum capillus-veneris]|uniref:Uncharacterized protein n=1 Tax=Adiantum capillus-veneris TaxID=13818 RepID=A0A9D4URB7_ADICA|nr:hypothetical protein GOP47_0012785 [Adiantum capillus-veneris]
MKASISAVLHLSWSARAARDVDVGSTLQPSVTYLCMTLRFLASWSSRAGSCCEGTPTLTHSTCACSRL